MPHRILILASNDDVANRARNAIIGRFGSFLLNHHEPPKLNTERVCGLVYPWEIAKSIPLDFKASAKMTYPRAQLLSKQIIEHLEKKDISVETRILMRPNVTDGQHYFSQGLIIR